MQSSHLFLDLILIGVLLLQLSICSPEVLQRQPTCTEVIIPIIVNAENIYMGPTTTMAQALSLATNTLSFLVSLLFNEVVSDTFNIAGRYCEPENFVPARANTLQFLIHGATYNRNYWSGAGPPGSNYGDQYSWISYASKEGYPTFSIDRLGSGNSSKPDPILIVQTPAQVEIAHQIVKMAREGSPPFPRNFTKVIIAGHSLGSVITQGLSVAYPTDADAIILTGYSSQFLIFVPGFFLTAAIFPAMLVQPEKYGTLPVGYLEASSLSGIEYLFWYDPYANGTYYDPAFLAYDFSIRGHITVGEGATAAVAGATASEFKGSVLVVTGQQDVLFCGSTAFPRDGPGKCVGGKQNYLEKTQRLYPNANYEWYSVPNAGHCWHYHYSAQKGFKATHDWLASQKF